MSRRGRKAARSGDGGANRVIIGADPTRRLAMHQPDTRPRRSLYFDYHVHPAAPIPNPGPDGPPPVVVVGAGPIGLTLALDLARHGVRCVLLEAEQQVSEGSRAIVFTRRSMEIMQQVGGDAAVTARGLPWRFGNSFYAGRRVYRMAAPHDDNDRFWPMINLQQPVLETVLLGLVAAQPLIELRWGHRVLGLPRNDPGDGDGRAELAVDTPTGEYRQAASWVVACDGARSSLRQIQGLRLEGDAYEGRFVIADIRIDLPLPTERLAFFDPPWNPGNTALMHRQPGGLWRIDYQLPAGETPEQALDAASLRERIDAQLAMVGAEGAAWELDWSSVYSARAMTLPRYVEGRVCYAGDAAHLLPIFGVRGANTGWQDGQGLSWRLAMVVHGHAGPALLESYSDERVAAAREIILEAGRSTRFMTPPSDGFRLLRDAVLSLSLSHDFVRPLFHWRTSRPHTYRGSALNDSGDDDRLFAHGPADGEAMRNVRMGTDEFLMDRPFAGFQLLFFGEGLAADMAALVSDWRGRGVPLQVLFIGRSVTDQPIAAPDPDPVNRWIADPQGRVWQAYGAVRGGAAYLIRPDQHVCARWQTLQADRLDKALATALGQTGPTCPAAGPATVAGNDTASAAPEPVAGSGLSLAALEQAYDALAQGIDRAPHRERFLVKLALLLAQRSGDAAGFAQALADAQRDL